MKQLIITIIVFAVCDSDVCSQIRYDNGQYYHQSTRLNHKELGIMLSSDDLARKQFENYKSAKQGGHFISAVSGFMIGWQLGNFFIENKRVNSYYLTGGLGVAILGIALKRKSNSNLKIAVATYNSSLGYKDNHQFIPLEHNARDTLLESEKITRVNRSAVDSYEGKQLSQAQLFKLLKTKDVSKIYVNSYKSSKEWGRLFSFIGIAGLTWQLTNVISSERKTNSTILGIFSIVTLVGLVSSASAASKIEKAVSAFNQYKPQARLQGSIDINRLSLSSSGIGLVYSF